MRFGGRERLPLKPEPASRESPVMRWQRGLWLFLVPSFGLMTVVLLWPLAYAAYLSTFDYYLGSREMRFVGLGELRATAR